jgi:hypothetical protein
MRPVEFYGRVGGNVPSAEEVASFVRKIAGQYGVAEPPAEPQKQAELQEEMISHV